LRKARPFDDDLAQLIAFWLVAGGVSAKLFLLARSGRRRGRYQVAHGRDGAPFTFGPQNTSPDVGWFWLSHLVGALTSCPSPTI
jgi:hypothetical protein